MSLVDAIRQGRRPLAALRLKREQEASDRGAADLEPQEPQRAASGRGAGPSGRPCAAAAASSFYAAGERLRRVEHRVLRFLAAVQARLAGAAAAPGLYASFPTQAPALAFADAHSAAGGEEEELRVFSAEAGPAARRRFVATSVAELWRRYAATPPPLRHWYEIIREGAPCHLYFDLEFATAANPGAEGPAAVEALLALAADALRERFGLEMEPRCGGGGGSLLVAAPQNTVPSRPAACPLLKKRPRPRSWALELDSTTPTKWSRHVILRIPGAAFASNAHAGALVRDLCARAEAAAAGGDARAALLRVARADGSPGSSVDAGVYTRNRAFRLYLSSKAGKEAVLQLTGAAAGGSRRRRAAAAGSVALCALFGPWMSGWGQEPGRG